MRISLTFFFSIIITTLLASEEPDAKFNQVDQIKNQSLVNFRKNLGQWDKRILYEGANKDAQIRFLENGLSFAFIREREGSQDTKEFLVWNVEFEGSNKSKMINSFDKSNSSTNYLFGTDRSKWVINAPDFKRISYDNIYDDIDLHYYSIGRDLKYDYILGRGAEMSDIKMSFTGVEDININRAGELEIITQWGTLLENKPYSYQIIDGEQREVDIRYELIDNNTYGFKAYGNYDKEAPLVIDPVILNYCTYVAGNTGFGYVNETKVNDKGELFGTGWTTSHFPITPGAYDNTQACCGGVPNAFVFKMKRDGSGLVFATYMGDSGSQANGRGLAIADNDDVYVVAESGEGMPITANAYKKTGSFTSSAIFRLSNDGTNVHYGTYTDVGILKDIDIDEKEDVYVTGQYARASKFSKDLSRKIYEFQPSGATKNSYGYDLVVNNNGEAFIAGVTGKNFQTTAGSYQKNFGGILDGFVYKMAADGQSVLKSTYIGGNNVDEARALDLDVQGNVYVTGQSKSSNFDLSINAYIKDNGWLTAPAPGDGCPQPFVLKLAADFSTALYSTYIGGLKGNYDAVSASMGCAQIATGIAVSSKGQAVVTGFTAAEDFPATTCNTQFTSFNGRLDCFVVRLNETGTEAYYSALIAGSNWDYGGTSAEKGRASVTLLEDDCQELEAFVSISTHSYDWPTTTGAFQESLPGAVDQPVIYNLKPIIEPEFSYTTPRCDQAVTFTDMTTGSCVENWATSNWTPSSWVWDFGDGTTSSEQNPSHFFTKPGTYEVKLRVMCPEDSTSKKIVIPNPFNTFELGPDLNICPEVALNEVLDAGSQPAGVTYQWNTGSNQQTITVTAAGKYWVTISDGSCSSTDTLSITQSKMSGSVETTRPTCAGEKNGSIKALPEGGTPPYSFLWGDGQQSQTAEGLGAGNYTVSVTDKNGCKLDATLTLDEPDLINASVSSQDANCNGTGGSASVVASGGTGQLSFTWTNGSIVSNGTSVSDLPVGNYTLTVKDDNGCEVNKNFAITQTPSFVNATLSFKQDADCSGNGGMATITPVGGNSPYTYQWNTGQTDRAVTGLPAGSYTVEVTDKNGCSGNIAFDINSAGDLIVEASINVNQGCDRFGAVVADASVTASGGTEPYTYLWNDMDNQTTATATGLSKGTYTVVVSDAVGCSASELVVVEDVILVDISTIQVPSCGTCTDGVATVSVSGKGLPPFTYRWDDPLEQTTVSATGLTNGIYVVTVTDANGCFNSDTLQIGVTGIEDPNDENLISIYPNPSQGDFVVDLKISSKDSDETVEVYDLAGKLWLQEYLTSHKCRIRLNNINSGLYLVVVTTKENKYVKKIRIQK